MTLLRQEQAVELLAKQQAAVQAQEKKLEESQERMKRKLELLDRASGHQKKKASGGNGTTEGTEGTTASNTSSTVNTNETVPSAGTPEREPFEKFMITVVYSPDHFMSILSYLL